MHYAELNRIFLGKTFDTVNNFNRSFDTFTRDKTSGQYSNAMPNRLTHASLKRILRSFVCVRVIRIILQGRTRGRVLRVIPPPRNFYILAEDLSIVSIVE